VGIAFVLHSTVFERGRGIVKRLIKTRAQGEMGEIGREVVNRLVKFCTQTKVSERGRKMVNCLIKLGINRTMGKELYKRERKK
jgi:hypothetical protein